MTNLIHISKNAVEIQCEGQKDYISLLKDDRLSYIPMEKFHCQLENVTLTCLISFSIEKMLWKEVQANFRESAQTYMWTFLIH